MNALGSLPVWDHLPPKRLWQRHARVFGLLSVDMLLPFTRALCSEDTSSFTQFASIRFFRSVWYSQGHISTCLSGLCRVSFTWNLKWRGRWSAASNKDSLQKKPPLSTKPPLAEAWVCSLHGLEGVDAQELWSGFSGPLFQDSHKLCTAPHSEVWEYLPDFSFCALSHTWGSCC